MEQCDPNDRIHIWKVDEVYLGVTSPNQGIERELWEHFSFFVPNARFDSRFKNHMWDGKIHLYSSKDKVLYIGLYKYLLAFAQARNYTIDNHYQPINNNVSADEIISFANSLHLTVDGKYIKPHPYQLLSALKGINNQRLLLLSPTASGKSLVLYMWSRWFMNKGNILIVVPTTALVHQMKYDFQDYSAKDSSFHPDWIHIIYEGQSTKIELPVTVSTWQSIYEMPAKWFDQFHMITIDECHLAKAKSLKGILEKTKKTPVKFGTTGTLDGTQTHKMVLEGLFSPVFHATTTKELMDDKKVADLKVECIVLKHSPKMKKKLDYSGEIEYLNSNEKRNQFIAKLATGLKGNTLVLFNYVYKHGMPLFDLIKTMVDPARKLFFVYQKVDGKERNEYRQIVEQEIDAIVVASYGTFSTGINIRNLNNLVLAAPSKSRVRILQSIGRSLRLSDVKTSAVVYDIADDLGNNNITLNQFHSRIAIYGSEQFNFKVRELSL